MAKPTVAHLFCGIGGGALGFKNAGFRSVLSVDKSEAACEDFESIVGEPALQMDLAVAMPRDLHEVCRESPDVVFLSPPCKGFSGMLPDDRSGTDHYSGLNSLAERGIWLALESWERKPRLIVMENVKRIVTRGKEWLARVVSMLHAYGYAVDQSVHDCGPIGGLAQQRNRYLLVARKMDEVPVFLHRPAPQRAKTIGEVLAGLPELGSSKMHSIPRMTALNWARLASVPRGCDWKALKGTPLGLSERKGRPNGPYGVEDWDGRCHAVLGHSSYRESWSSVADPTCASWDGPPDINDPNPTVLRLRSSDGTWHRPMTTLELAVLQSFPSDIKMAGRNRKGWRERIGNAVPPRAAEAIATSCRDTLEDAESDEWVMNMNPVWVRRTEVGFRA